MFITVVFAGLRLKTASAMRAKEDRLRGILALQAAKVAAFKGEDGQVRIEKRFLCAGVASGN